MDRLSGRDAREPTEKKKLGEGGMDKELKRGGGVAAGGGLSLPESTFWAACRTRRRFRASRRRQAAGAQRDGAGQSFSAATREAKGPDGKHGRKCSCAMR